MSDPLAEMRHRHEDCDKTACVADLPRGCEVSVLLAALARPALGPIVDNGCPACHHPDHDPGSCEWCPRCELHTDDALAWVSRLPASGVRGPEEGLREALLLAIEEVDNAWHDEGTHVEWDEDVLPERLIALRCAYHAHEDAALRSSPAAPQPDTALSNAAYASGRTHGLHRDDGANHDECREYVVGKCVLRSQPDTGWYKRLDQVHLAQIVHEAMGYTDEYHGEPNCGIVAERIAAALRSTPAAPEEDRE